MSLDRGTPGALNFEHVFSCLGRANGALADGFDVELLSYEAPTYFGMACASYLPLQD